MKRIIILGLVATIFISFVGCGGKKAEELSSEDTRYEEYLEEEGDIPLGVRELLDNLEDAYNSRDIYKLISCFDPSISQAYKGILKLLGVDGETMFNMLPFASAVLAQTDSFNNESWGNAKLSAVSYADNGNNGDLDYIVNIDYQGRDSLELEEVIQLIVVDGKYYISAIQSSLDKYNDEKYNIPVNPDITEREVQGELFTICIENKYGYVNEHGDEVVSPFFTEMYDFDGDYCPVQKGNKFAFINRMGELQTDYLYSRVSEYPSGDGFYKVCQDGVWGAFSPSTNTIIDCQYEDIGWMEDGIMPVKTNGYWGAVDKNNNFLIEPMYSGMFSEITNGKLGVSINDAWGIIDASGNTLLPLNADRIQLAIFPGGELIVENNKRIYNLLNGDYQVIIENISDYDIKFGSTYYDYGDTIKRHSLSEFDTNSMVIIKESEYSNRTNVYTQNEYLYDKKGNLIFDVTSFVDDRLSSGGKKSKDNISILGLKPIDTENDIYIIYYSDGAKQRFNIIDKTGKMLLKDWPEYRDGSTYGGWHIYWSEENLLFVVYDYKYGDGSERHETEVYDTGTGNKITTLPFVFDSFVDVGNELVFYSWRGQYGVCEYNNKTFGDVTWYKSGDVTPYFDKKMRTLNTEYYFKNGLSRETVILSDGIFYGIYGRNGFIGDGFKYTKAEYDHASDIFTCELGSTTKRFRVGHDGNVIEIAD